MLYSHALEVVLELNCTESCKVLSLGLQHCTSPAQSLLLKNGLAEVYARSVMGEQTLNSALHLLFELLTALYFFIDSQYNLGYERLVLESLRRWVVRIVTDTEKTKAFCS